MVDSDDEYDSADDGSDRYTEVEMTRIKEWQDRVDNISPLVSSKPTSSPA